MCMSLILDYWETLSLTAGCNLYSTHFRLCVLTVRSADQGSRRDTTMYFREREQPVVDSETFLTTAVPKVLMASLILFLNLLAMATMCRSNRALSSYSSTLSSSSVRGSYILPQSTQGLLHSLFLLYIGLGLLTLYSQVSLSTFILADVRIFEDQGRECLTVNSLVIALSVAVSLHLLSLAVDRMLAAYLPFSKYTAMAQGTVPLWLLAIWLPAGILGALPLAGWKTNFSFCLFLHQFNDDYLRFVAGFYITALLLIPFLYFFFLAVLKPERDPRRPLYRWHRKLQAHHRLSFILVLAINIICWSPFHIYLLLACNSCAYAHLASGFTLEYLYMLALVPSLLIPLMFSVRANVVSKCAAKMVRCVHFHESGLFADVHINPLSNKSPLFFIDDALKQSRSAGSTTTTLGSLHNSTKPKTKEFFVPTYLPVNNENPGPPGSLDIRHGPGLGGPIWDSWRAKRVPLSTWNSQGSKKHRSNHVSGLGLGGVDNKTFLDPNNPGYFAGVAGPVPAVHSTSRSKSKSNKRNQKNSSLKPLFVTRH